VLGECSLSRSRAARDGIDLARRPDADAAIVLRVVLDEDA